MKLLRYGPKGNEKPGLLDDSGRIRDLSNQVADIDASTLAPDRLAALANMNVEALPVVDGSPRMGVPVAEIGKIIAIGLNYSEHAKESGHDLPTEPIVFTKAVTALTGPNDGIVMPKGSQKTDWEVELALVIGRKAQYVEEADALSYVAGYATMNDVSERAFQLEQGGQWVKGKSFDTSAPLGPWLVTADEVPDPQTLNLWLEVNGEVRQKGNTRTMIFTVAHLVSYVSCFMTLLPGDVITTGTPPGVGLGYNPPIFLKAGDVVRLGVEGLGEQRQDVKAWEA
ncbi:MAG: fumarylacetoacetate hydrolase family protein [Rhodospirillales bacterium]|nr:fumarylacetoacetate hydrolase family protein [Rhodospirillales bacterium]